MGKLTFESAKVLRALKKGELVWNEEYKKLFLPLIEGQEMPNTLANFCGRCGTDLRPYHEEIMKHSDLKPLPQ